MSLTRIHNFSVSLDGFATGEPQSAEAPFGHAGQRLHQWMMATQSWDASGTAGVDNAFAQQHDPGIGAEIMGANKFGPPGSPTISCHQRVSNIHSCSRSPAWPNGASWLRPSPVPNPSSETEKKCT